MQKTYSIVNKFNKSIAIKLRHNYNLKLTFIRKRAYTIMQYYMQYITKAHILINIAITAAISLKGI